MKSILAPILAAALPLLGACTAPVDAKPAAARAAQAQVARGKALVEFGSCHDCHTPWVMGPKGPQPDMTRALSGHPASLVMPEPPKPNGPWIWAGAASNTAFAGPWGVSYATNLTPDQVSGLGIWTEDLFIKTMRTGRHMGVSRQLLPPMPWQALNSLPDEDLKAIFAYLKTLEPVRNEVPDPVLAPHS